MPKTGQTNSFYPGDDGDQGKGVAWPNPRFADHGNGTVSDNLTGLMWAKNADLWGNVNWETAITNCNALELDGHDDWRLPNIRELQSLLDYRNYDPVLPADCSCTNVQSDYYWTSTTWGSSASAAWYVHLWDGLVYYEGKSSTEHNHHAWPVRGGP